ncbi:hypothetical protein EJB05_30937, partial [Eragrostis curvula]
MGGGQRQGGEEKGQSRGRRRLGLELKIERGSWRRAVSAILDKLETYSSSGKAAKPNLPIYNRHPLHGTSRGRSFCWTSKIIVDVAFRCTQVFLPINIDNQHWYLAVINAKKRKIQVLDSLCWTHSRDDLKTTRTGGEPRHKPKDPATLIQHGRPLHGTQSSVASLPHSTLPDGRTNPNNATIQTSKN